MAAKQDEVVWKALDSFRIECPSWAFSNTGTRFGKFIQPAAATTTEEKLSDAGQVNKFTGCCPTVAVHVLWDFPDGIASTKEVMGLAAKHGVRIGAINPNVFQDQIYKYGSLGNPDPAIRKAALDHILDSIEIAHQTGSRDLSLWFADGSSFPGTASIRRRKQWFADCLKEAHGRLKSNEADAGGVQAVRAFLLLHRHRRLGHVAAAGKASGPQAKVLVDTGHHYQAQNIEQIVAWLLSENMLGGFHFNDRRYADDDLTLGSIDPYQVFRIFNEIATFELETGQRADIAYMVDQSHNLKGKIEEMIQTVITAQELYAKAALVDQAALAEYQDKCALIDAEECLKSAFATDVRPAIREWRKSKGIGEEPLAAFRASGYLERITKERAHKNAAAGGSYA